MFNENKFNSIHVRLPGIPKASDSQQSSPSPLFLAKVQWFLSNDCCAHLNPPLVNGDKIVNGSSYAKTFHLGKLLAKKYITIMNTGYLIRQNVSNPDVYADAAGGIVFSDY